MDARQAAHTLEVIRTLMERTCQYQLLTARAGLAAGSLAGVGALLFLFLDPGNPVQFGAVWALVFAGSLLATFMGTVMRGRERGERVWSRQATTVLLTLAPSLFAALVLTVLLLPPRRAPVAAGRVDAVLRPGALATAAYAPRSIRWLGVAFLPLGGADAVAGAGLGRADDGPGFRPGPHQSWGRPADPGAAQGRRPPASLRSLGRAESRECIQATARRPRPGAARARPAGHRLGAGRGRGLTFTELRDALEMTDGNLSVHLQKLEEKGYVAIDKQFVGRRPQTSCQLTRTGRQAFTHYLDHLEAIVRQGRGQAPA